MAKCESYTSRRVEVIEREVTETTYILELTEDEAKCIHTLVGACRAHGPTSPIFDALNKAGLNEWDNGINLNRDPDTFAYPRPLTLIRDEEDNA